MKSYSEQTRRLLFWLIFFGIFLLGRALPVHALLSAHQAEDGCNTCHSLHASPGGALFAIGTDPELLCLSCHGAAGTSTLKVAGHKLNGGDIACNECHNSHNNGQENSRTNVDGTYNVKLIGLTLDYNEDPPGHPSSPQIHSERVAVGLKGLKDVVYNSAVNSADYARADGKGVCNACHGPAIDPSDDPIHNIGQDCAGCHAHDGGFAGSGDCTACHDGSGVGAELVSVNSSHSTNTLNSAVGVAFTCENCHTAHEAGNVQIPNNNAVGIMYNTAGHNGISLGADDGNTNDAVGTTEAEICWNCHDGFTPAISEWGLNTETNGASFPNYNTGTLSTSNWVGIWDGISGTTAVWSSANFSYKQNSIESTHSVNENSGMSGLDVVENIRCSYCHDVHDTFGGPNNGAGPFLRGNWVGNPYQEDGAPRNDSSPSLPGDTADYSAYDVPGKFGAVPRGGTTYTALGGYFIDQNSGSPTDDALMDTPDEFAGLCVLCHENGSPDDGSWDAAEIDAINKFGTPSDDWVGTNGHAAVVKGGGSTGAVNIFTMAKRFPTTAWSEYSAHGSDGGNPVMAYLNARIYNSKKKAWGDAYGEGLRGTDSLAFQYVPEVDGTTGSTRQYNYNNYDWGATVVVEGASSMSDSGTDTNFHQFTCSKCHNPHASRLPRLLITNCLDTNHNTWAATALVTPSSDTNGGSSSLSPENQSVPLSQVTSAQNCHRLADPNYPQAGPQGVDPPASGGEDGGWNRVTPWVEFP